MSNKKRKNKIAIAGGKAKWASLSPLQKKRHLAKMRQGFQKSLARKSKQVPSALAREAHEGQVL